jgi:hypothetical protein
VDQRQNAISGKRCALIADGVESECGDGTGVATNSLASRVVGARVTRAKNSKEENKHKISYEKTLH